MQTPIGLGGVGTSARLLAFAFGVIVSSVSFRAHADTPIIKNPGQHSRHSFEAEPHLLLGVVDPPGLGHGDGFGVGFRGTVTLLDYGFIRKINNSVGIGFGADWVHYNRGRGRCNAPTGPCIIDDSESVSVVWLPVVMQWNFWLTKTWSVFGEPGAALRYESPNLGGSLHLEALQLYAGARLHFSETTTLTMRIGYPTFSLGVSFLL